MKKFIAICLVAAGLTACANIPEEARVEAATLATCSTYTSTLRALSVFKPQMSQAQIDNVGTLNMVAAPICINADNGTSTEVSLNALRDALRELVKVQQEVEE